jgi:uncharacterized protein (TIRG00374 family)
LKRGILSAVAVLAALVGVATFAHLLRATDVWAELGRTPPVLLWLVPLTAVPIVLGTLSWARCLPRTARPAFAHVFGIRLAGEAVNNALVSAYVAGEPVKAVLAARRGAPAAGAMASVLIGKTSFILGEVLFLVIGVAAAARVFGLDDGLVRALLSVAAGGLLVCLIAIAVQQHRPLSRGARFLAAMRLGSRRLWDRALPGADAIDRAVREFYRGQRGGFCVSVAWATAGWLLGSLELWIYLRVVTDVPSPLLLAIVLEAGIAVTKGLSFFVPASIGVQEGGIASLFIATGVGAEIGGAYAILRRLREMFWVGLGFLALWWYLRREPVDSLPAPLVDR